MSAAADIHVNGARDVFEADTCLTCRVEHGAVHAAGRWRIRWAEARIAA